MTVKFQVHIPDFAYSGQTIPVQEFDDLSSLLESLQKDRGDWSFSHWAYSGRSIMGVWNEGLSWWVMGHTDACMADIPEWKPVFLAEINGVETRLENQEVLSSCRGVLTLKDGRVVKQIKRPSTKAD